MYARFTICLKGLSLGKAEFLYLCHRPICGRARLPSTLPVTQEKVLSKMKKLGQPCKCLQAPDSHATMNASRAHGTNREGMRVRLKGEETRSHDGILSTGPAKYCGVLVAHT